MSENKKIVIELVNLGEAPLRTVKRELKVLIEDYCWKKAICECIKVTEEK